MTNIIDYVNLNHKVISKYFKSNLLVLESQVLKGSVWPDNLDLKQS